MSGAAWAATGAGATVVGICIVGFWRLQHAPQVLHPWLYRLVTFGTYLGSAACALSALGAYAVSIGGWAARDAGGLEHGWVHVALAVGSFMLLCDLVIAMTRHPGAHGLFPALLLPFSAALASTSSHGLLHGALTLFPVIQWCADIAQGIG